MNHSELAEHAGTYTINGTLYKVLVNFVTEKIFIKTENSFLKFPMSEYMNHEGNMESFIASKI